MLYVEIDTMDMITTGVNFHTDEGGESDGGLAATLIFAVSATVRILLPSVSLPAGQPPEIRSLSLASKGCYSVACLNEGNPFVP